MLHQTAVADDANTRLAEYSTLRDEGLGCQNAQRDLVKLNVTASGAVAALGIANSKLPGLLVILAFLSPVLGLLWIDLDSKVHRLARYVSRELWIWTPSWESWLITEKKNEKVIRFAGHAVPSVLVFLLPAVAGLIVSSQHKGDIGGAIVWGVAFVPVAIYVAVGSWYLWKQPPNPLEEHASVKRRAN